MKRSFTISHPDKILFPKHGITKADVARYYSMITPIILPYLKDRPQSLNRHMHGVGKKNFFQKNINFKTPDFVTTIPVHTETTNEDIRYLVCQNKQTLQYLVQLGCIELNPWNARTGSMHRPDYLVIDLDPGDNTWAQLVHVVREVKKVLDSAGLSSYLKTSGKTGLHIYVPLGARYDFAIVRAFAKLIATIVNSRLPDITSIERDPKKRTKKIYLDYLQNSIGQTLASVYSLRPTPDATVSTPLRWSELSAKSDPRKYTIQTIFKRLQKYGDLWSGLLKEKNDLKKALTELQQQYSS